MQFYSFLIFSLHCFPIHPVMVNLFLFWYNGFVSTSPVLIVFIYLFIYLWVSSLPISAANHSFCCLYCKYFAEQSYYSPSKIHHKASKQQRILCSEIKRMYDKRRGPAQDVPYNLILWYVSKLINLS